MSLEENKALVRSLFERIVNDQDLEQAERIIAAEVRRPLGALGLRCQGAGGP